MTGSTLAEGLSANGSLYYRGNAGYKNDASYTSLSHGWSTGPTIGLSLNVAGLEIVRWKTWRFRPMVGDLKNVESGFESPMGEFGVNWKVIDNENQGWSFEANVTTPVGMKGVVELPWKCTEVLLDREELDGKEVEGGGTKRVEASGCH